jgi:hypothetical protein
MDCANHYYRVLDLQPGASKDEVKQAYKDLISVWHPDRFSHNPRLQQKAQEKVKEINAAYAFFKSYNFTPETIFSTSQYSSTQYSSYQSPFQYSSAQYSSYQNPSPHYSTQDSTYQNTSYQNKAPQPKAETLDLSYLQLLMASGRWQDADLETKAILLKVMDREHEGWLKEEDVKAIPVNTLEAIDRLWVKYSSGRFGFSTQCKIWRELKCKTDAWMFAQSKSECKFGAQIGWYVNNIWLLQWDQFHYGFRAPVGSLPREYIFALDGWWSYSQNRSGHLLWRFEEVFLRLESADV